MYYLQHERPCCIGYTNSSRRREFFRNDQVIIRGLLYGLLNSIPYIRIAWHRIVIFNAIVLDVIAFMIVKLSFRLFIVRLIHDLVLNLLNSLNFGGFSKFPFVVPLWTKWLTKPVIWASPIRKITDRHVTHLSQSEHAISPEAACAV